MSLFRLDASIKVDGSASKELADIVEEHWADAHPDGVVVRRHVGIDPLPSHAWAAALSASWTPEGDRTEQQREASALAAGLAEEVRAADAVLLAVPLYNFGVSQHFKTWVDLMLTANEPGARVLEGKPTVLTTVRGGAYGAGTPREGWDHSTGYLRRMLEDVWGADLTVVEREFTLVGVNPALDEFADLADRMRQDAIAAADEAGRVLAKAS